MTDRDKYEAEMRIMRMTPLEREREQERLMVEYLARLDLKRKS